MKLKYENAITAEFRRRCRRFSLSNLAVELKMQKKKVLRIKSALPNTVPSNFPLKKAIKAEKLKTNSNKM